MRRSPGTGEVGLTTVAVREILAPVGEPGGRAETVAARLGEAIRLGLVLDRERLPPEPELAGQLGVSTVTLREALAVLREQGLVVTRRGRGGGTFVRAPADVAEGLVRRLGQFTTQGLRDLGDHRCAVSGAAALLAAQRASAAEAGELRRQVDRLRAARTPGERRRAHTQFRVMVAVAAQSPRLAREEIRLAAEIGDISWLRVTLADHEESVRATAALAGAIGRGAAARARDLAESQVRDDTARLLRLRIRMYAAAAAGDEPAIWDEPTGRDQRPGAAVAAPTTAGGAGRADQTDSAGPASPSDPVNESQPVGPPGMAGPAGGAPCPE